MTPRWESLPLAARRHVVDVALRALTEERGRLREPHRVDTRADANLNAACHELAHILEELADG